MYDKWPILKPAFRKFCYVQLNSRINFQLAYFVSDGGDGFSFQLFLFLHKALYDKLLCAFLDLIFTRFVSVQRLEVSSVESREALRLRYAPYLILHLDLRVYGRCCNVLNYTMRADIGRSLLLSKSVKATESCFWISCVRGVELRGVLFRELKT